LDTPRRGTSKKASQPGVEENSQKIEEMVGRTHGRGKWQRVRERGKFKTLSGKKKKGCAKIEGGKGKDVRTNLKDMPM